MTDEQRIREIIQSKNTCAVLCGVGKYCNNCTAALKALTTLLNEARAEAEIGWKIELPNLTGFQIDAFSRKDGEMYTWKSPIYDIKNLPAKLTSTSTPKPTHESTESMQTKEDK